MSERLLITIRASHYCEKARWALERLGLSFRERCHPPVLHIPRALRRGGRRTVPVLVEEDGAVYPDSTDILQHLDRGAPPDLRLYPDDAALRREVEALEDDLDEVLGPHVRRWAYDGVLPDRSLALRVATAGASRLESGLLRATFPLAAGLMKRTLRITPEGVARSRARIDEVLGRAEARLAHGGGRYLLGDRFTAADLTLASLLAPAVLPPEYGGALPRLEELPGRVAAEVEAYRARPAGAHALRLYREERRRPAPATVG